MEDPQKRSPCQNRNISTATSRGYFVGCTSLKMARKPNTGPLDCDRVGVQKEDEDSKISSSQHLLRAQIHNLQPATKPTRSYHALTPAPIWRVHFNHHTVLMWLAFLDVSGFPSLSGGFWTPAHFERLNSLEGFYILASRTHYSRYSTN